MFIVFYDREQLLRLLYKPQIRCHNTYNCLHKVLNQLPRGTSYTVHNFSSSSVPWEIKKSNFGRYSADIEENANKLHFKCTDFNFSMHITVYAECI